VGIITSLIIVKQMMLHFTLSYEEVILLLTAVNAIISTR